MIFGLITTPLPFDHPAAACTNILVTKGASKDGSVITTYACDGRFHPRLRRTEAADHDDVWELLMIVVQSGATASIRGARRGNGREIQ